MTKIIEETKLVYQEGTSNKQYNISIKEIENKRYIVECKYGRIEASYLNTVIYPKQGNYNIYDAEDAAAAIIRKKIKKGYVKRYTR